MAAHLLSIPGTLFAATALPALLTLSHASRKRNRASQASLWAHVNPNLGRPTGCRLCGGSCTQPCQKCSGRGMLSRGGYTRHNTVRLQSLVGSKWTRVTALDGKWRHFVCVAKRGRSVTSSLAVLTCTCGPVADRPRIEVPVSELKSRRVWSGGWTTLKDIHSADAGKSPCVACKGVGVVPCPRCDGHGVIGFR